VSKLAHAADGLARKLKGPPGSVTVWGWYSEHGPTLVVELDPSTEVRPPSSFMGFAVDIRVRSADTAP
jgi:hypothetical protein